MCFITDHNCRTIAKSYSHKALFFAKYQGCTQRRGEDAGPQPPPPNPPKPKFKENTDFVDITIKV
jgi:hypothetical protein